MKTFNCSVSTLDNFVEAHDCEAVDCCDGSLIDNVVYATDKGYLFCYEMFLNEWSSAYRCVFCRYDEKKLDKAWSEWYAFCAAYEMA